LLCSSYQSVEAGPLRMERENGRGTILCNGRGLGEVRVVSSGARLVLI